jgi:hypothetical protein
MGRARRRGRQATSTFSSSTSPITNMAAVDMIAERWLPPVAQVIAP